MNLMKEINVSGTLFPTHARLSFQFVFHNATKQPLSPTYLFPLPQEAAITGMQILTESKTLLRAEIIPITEVDSDLDGFRLIQLEPQLYSLTWECLSPEESCTILLDCLLPLCPRGNGCRLAIPFGIPSGSLGTVSPCPVNLNFQISGMTPAVLSPEDCYEPDERSFSSTRKTEKDFVLNLLVEKEETCGYLQEEFNQGCGFARIYFPSHLLHRALAKQKVLLLCDTSREETQASGNLQKELFFRVFSSLPSDCSVTVLTSDGTTQQGLTREELYSLLTNLPLGVGSLENLLDDAKRLMTPDTLVILISNGLTVPDTLPDFPLLLVTTGDVLPTKLSRHLSGEHLHFYPSENPEALLPDFLQEMICPTLPAEVFPEGGRTKESFLLHPQQTLPNGYFDVIFSYHGHPPFGFSLWQDGSSLLTCPLKNTEGMTRSRDVEQLFALGKITQLNSLLEKAGAVSGRSIKKELEHLQVKYHILGSETVLKIPTNGQASTCIPLRVYTSIDAGGALPNHPTIFGEDTRRLAPNEKERLMEQCRKIIHASVRSNGSIHSPLGITPQMSAEETAISYLALLADGTTDLPLLSDALAYLESAPKTPWSFLIRPETDRESLKNLLPALPDFESLLSATEGTLSLTTAAYLLLWLSLMD